ncbi:hypothetical protein ACXJPO_000186 [Pseudomonas aeruginosa]
MKQFAKLFEFEDLGQVLVMLDRGDDGPEVRLYFKPDGLGVCSVACSNFPGDEDEQWDYAERGSPRWTPKGFTTLSPRQ